MVLGCVRERCSKCRRAASLKALSTCGHGRARTRLSLQAPSRPWRPHKRHAWLPWPQVQCTLRPWRPTIMMLMMVMHRHCVCTAPLSAAADHRQGECACPPYGNAVSQTSRGWVQLAGLRHQSTAEGHAASHCNNAAPAHQGSSNISLCRVEFP